MAQGKKVVVNCPGCRARQNLLIGEWTVQNDVRRCDKCGTVFMVETKPAFEVTTYGLSKKRKRLVG